MNEENNKKEVSKSAYLIMHKDKGKFYRAYGVSAYILGDLFGYKVVNGECGFPDTAIDKVKARLNEEKISYRIIFNKDEIVDNAFKDNNYEKFYPKASEKMNVDEKLAIIMQQLEKIEFSKLDNVIELINEEIDN